VTLNDGTVLVTQGASTGSDDDVYYSAAPLAPLQITTPSLLRAPLRVSPTRKSCWNKRRGLAHMGVNWRIVAFWYHTQPERHTVRHSTVFGAFPFTVASY